MLSVPSSRDVELPREGESIIQWAHAITRKVNRRIIGPNVVDGPLGDVLILDSTSTMPAATSTEEGYAVLEDQINPNSFGVAYKMRRQDDDPFGPWTGSSDESDRIVLYANPLIHDGQYWPAGTVVSYGPDRYGTPTIRDRAQGGC
jgi:hypothetical protein